MGGKRPHQHVKPLWVWCFAFCFALYVGTIWRTGTAAKDGSGDDQLGHYILSISGSNESYYYARMGSLLKGCKDICRADMTGEPSLFFDYIEKEVDCDTLLTNAAIDDVMVEAEPPKEVPPAMLDAFTYGGRVEVAPYGYFNQRYAGSAALVSKWTEEMIEEMKAQCQAETLHGTYGVEDTKALVESIRHLNVEGASVLVVGSENPWVEACALGMGAAHVTTLEYGEIVSTHPQVTTLTPKRMRESAGDFKGRFDAVLTFSSVEHSGLGRYGDAMNPWGDRQSVARAWCMTRPGGRIALGVPTGTDAIRYNAHRQYGDIQLSHLLANWKQVWMMKVPSMHGHGIYVAEKTKTASP